MNIFIYALQVGEKTFAKGICYLVLKYATKNDIEVSKFINNVFIRR